MSTEAKRLKRLRRVLVLACSFGRNLAYYRAGWASRLVPAYPTNSLFWLQVNSNFLEMAVLDWCKLFGGRKEKHDRENIVTDPVEFKSGLLHHLGVDEVTFGTSIRAMRKYRDHYIAHADIVPQVDVPILDVAKEAAWFYHKHVVKKELRPEDLPALSSEHLVEIDRGYAECQEEAKAVYLRAVAQVQGR